jgi:hypothetical protein
MVLVRMLQLEAKIQSLAQYFEGIGMMLHPTP